MTTAVLVKALGAFFAIMNPFVNLPLFLSLTQDQDATTQRRTAVRTTISSTVMCAVVLLLGATILRFFGIGVDDFRIAGGIVLLIISLSMLNGSGSSAHEGSKQEKKQHDAAGGGNDVAFYPMTFPILVGPGTIATIIVIQSQARGLGGHAAVAAALAAVLVALGIVLYFSSSIGARLSMTMRTIMTRLMGMILASIAVQMIVVGIQHLFPGLAR
ncbi:MarC family protein [Actinomyces sp. ZJ308]|uniref:MarC family protein n=1 Tax=Actinomyces sp. ZJ308 TaxID=2708342 RepID=UPI0014205F70|nr:MarC family protein [Actinomyces sp. ZJ308]